MSQQEKLKQQKKGKRQKKINQKLLQLKSQINKNKTKKNKKKKSSLKKASQNKTEPKKVSKRSIKEMRVIKISKMSGMKNFSYDGSDNLIIYGNGCNKSPGCIARLLMQRLYIALTVQRYDRDKYITVNNDSILQGYIKDYMINETFDTFSGPFDFGSIMFPDRRYGSFLFRDTFTSINITQYGFMAGQMYNISFTDMRMLDYFYCNLTSPPLVTCQNNGYPNPKNNYRCKCPNGYTGRYCEELESSSKGCPEQQIIVTKFNTTLEFNQTRRCNVNLTAPEGKRIHIYLNRTNAGVGTPCFERRGLEIKLLEDKSITGLCLCGFGSNMHLTSEGDSVFIQYNGIAVANKAVLYHCIEGECDNSLIKHPNGSEEEYNDEEEDWYY
uniref:EGF-like domain-containing protein n=1 Tax=Parastrongyloides trichosuri TaxID=131310 RepID=A0A0N5A150_PARTI